MGTVEELKKTLESRATQDAEELVRLQQFLNEMKLAGVVKTREYDLPQPDTVGHSARVQVVQGAYRRRATD